MNTCEGADELLSESDISIRRRLPVPQGRAVSHEMRNNNGTHCISALEMY
jgi:hypothetical protein